MEQFEIAISTFPSQDKTGVKVYPQMIWTELSKKCSITGSYPHKSFLYLKGHKVFSAVARLVEFSFIRPRSDHILIKLLL